MNQEPHVDGRSRLAVGTRSRVGNEGGLRLAECRLSVDKVGSGLAWGRLRVGVGQVFVWYKTAGGSSAPCHLQGFSREDWPSPS